MTRIILHEEQGPLTIENEGPVSLCRCGLSKDQPYCDGSHMKTRDEEDKKLYIYEDGRRREVDPQVLEEQAQNP